jgi:uncharacterized protein with PQ loop repeat
MGFAGNLFFVLQMYRIYSTKSSVDVSLGGFLISFISIASWLFYGHLINDKVVFLINLIGIFFATACLATIIFYRF